MPSHYERPRRYGEAGGRHPRARDQRMVYEVLLPLAMISVWGHGSMIASNGGTRAKFYQEVLQTTMALVCAITLISKRTQSQERADKYRQYLAKWRAGVNEKWKDEPAKPTWHHAFHLYDFILLFGPAGAYWVFAYERLIGQLQRIPKNHHLCEYGIQSIVMYTCLTGNLQPRRR